MKSIFGRMPQPVSHMGHPHWVAAVRVYRKGMIGSGSDASIALLDHPCNMGDAVEVVSATTRMVRRLTSAWRSRMKVWSAAHQASMQRPPPETDLQRLLRLRRELGDRVCGLIAPERAAIDILHIGKIAALAPRPPQGARLHRLADPSNGGSQRSFNVAVPEADDTTGTLIIYVTAGFLNCWDRLDEDLERFLTTRREVILVLIADRFRALEFSMHTYLFGILATAFPIGKFTTRLEAHNTSSVPLASRRPFTGMLDRPAWGVIMEGWRTVFGTAEPPATFSALVISVRSRRGPPSPT